MSLTNQSSTTNPATAPILDVSLGINNQLLRFGGVIGRRDYIINQLIIGGYVIGLVAVALGAVYLVDGPEAFSAIDGGEAGLSAVAQAALGGSILGSLPAAISHFSLDSRRIRDIRGTNHRHWAWYLGLLVASVIPFVNLLAAGVRIALYFVPGKITGKATGAAPPKTVA